MLSLPFVAVCLPKWELINCRGKSKFSGRAFNANPIEFWHECNGTFYGNCVVRRFTLHVLCGLISNALNYGDKVLRHNAAGTFEAQLKLTHAIINNIRFVIIISRTPHTISLIRECKHNYNYLARISFQSNIELIPHQPNDS